ncbi:hypothetical protein C8Q80DRAFT_597980 [Daedaleopsis nitida]|nr:hypothetical protein C8Q80DRAFT_597980 [Daedaleopsis nitida]
MTRDGFLPPLPLRTRMQVTKLLQFSPSKSALYRLVRPIMANTEAFREPDLCELLHLFADSLSSPSLFIDRVVRLFLAYQPPDYHLSPRTRKHIALLHVRVGNKRHSYRWTPDPRLPQLQPQVDSIRAVSSAQSLSDLVTSPLTSYAPSPYATLLDELALKDPSMAEYPAAVSKMQKEMPSLVPNLEFLNALLANEVVRRKYRAVFAIYRGMMSTRSLSDMPDATTFSVVFRAIARVQASAAHRRRGRHALQSADIPHPRSVYRDMLTCHAEYLQMRPTALTHTFDRAVLHRALAALLAMQDYPGAFMAIRAFNYFKSSLDRPTLATYKIVIKALRERILRELPQLALYVEPDGFWAYRFLGLEYLPRHLRGSLRTDLEMVHRLLVFGSESRTNLEFVDAPSYPFGEGSKVDVEVFKQLGMPTPLEVWGVRTLGGPERRCAVLPLERILRRATLASFKTMYSTRGQTSEALKEAKMDMIPYRVYSQPIS